MFSSSIMSLLAAFIFADYGGIAPASASPVSIDARATIACKKDDYAPFRLYAAPADNTTAEWQQVKLIDQPVGTTSETTQNLSVCPDASCGVLPAYWQLTDQVLYAVFPAGPADVITVNRPVKVNSVVQFVKGKTSSIQKQLTPEWCAVRNPNGSNGLPGFLSVLGSPKDFSMCTNMLGPGTPPRQDVYYKANTMDGGLEKFCKPIYLVMESIGIIAEPIPE